MQTNNETFSPELALMKSWWSGVVHLSSRDKPRIRFWVQGRSKGNAEKNSSGSSAPREVDYLMKRQWKRNQRTKG